MKYGQALSFIIHEENWFKKLAIATGFAILMPLGIGLLALTGWSMGVARRAIQREEQKLPSWSMLGKILIDGLKGLGVILVWFLPALVLSLAPTTISALSALEGNHVINFLPLNNKIIFWLYFTALIYCLYAGIMTTAGLEVLARSGSFRRSIKPSVVWLNFLSRKRNYVAVFVVLIFLGIFLTLFGASLCLVGLLPIWAYTFTVIGHLIGQASTDREPDLEMVV